MNRISFASDYTHSAHPAVLAAITADGASGRAHPGYGLDTECAAAADAIRDRAAAPGADVHFLVGGTQANATLIGTLLRPWQAAIAADTGHIAEHETGAIERTGHKVEVLPGADGKITAAQIAAFVAAHRGSGIPSTCPTRASSTSATPPNSARSTRCASSRTSRRCAGTSDCCSWSTARASRTA